MIEKKKIDTRCRLCLMELENEYSSIFSLNNKNQDCDGLALSTKIMICLSLPVQHNDLLSKKICIPCKKEVIHFYSFRERCHTAYYTLLLRRNDFNAINNLEDDMKNDKDNTKDLCYAQSHRATQDDTVCKDIALQNSTKHCHEYADDDDNNNLNDTTTNIKDENIGTNPEYSTNNGISVISNFPNSTEENIMIIGSNENQIEVLGYIEESMSYKCFHCDKLFSDLDTATNHCMKCTNINEHDVNVRLDDKECSEIIETVEYVKDDFTNDEEKLNITIETDTNNCSQIQDNLASKLLPKCRKHCRHTKCRRSVKRSEKIIHSCPQCGKSFPSACLLKRHTTVHTGERPYECDICGRRFSQVGALNFHKKFHVNPPYSCKICNKPFMRPSDMEKHMRTHTGEKPFSCQICQKQFAQTTAVQQHERIHTGAKPYICEICGKAFSQSANKRKHVLIHKEGAKPHVCKTCGRSFSDPREMELHKAGHGGGRPRECDYCGDRFRKLSEISDHIRRYHTFERPHKCAFCPKAFYALYSLKQHVMIHTGQKPYACDKCDHKFTQKGNLAKHYARKHSDYCYEMKEISHKRNCNEDAEEDDEKINLDTEKAVDCDVEKNGNLQVTKFKNSTVIKDKISNNGFQINT